MNEETKIKRNTIVCDKCRTRKQKCDGESPCAFCKRNQIDCCYTRVSKKRGPKRKKDEKKEEDGKKRNEEIPAVAVSDIITESKLHVKNERAHYVSLFREFSKYGTEPGEEETIIVPISPAKDMLLKVILAWSHRMRGGQKWANQFIQEAHNISHSLFDEVEPDVIKAFSALAWYYGAGGKSAHYSSIANGLARQLPEVTPHTLKFKYEAFFFSTLLDTAMTGKMKYESIINHPHSFLTSGIAGCTCCHCCGIPQRLQHLLVRMMATIALKIGVYYDPEAYVRIIDCSFTTQERDIFFECCDHFEAFMNAGEKLFGSKNFVYVLPLKAIKALLLYNEGEMEKSKAIISETVQISLQPHIAYILHNNPGPLILTAALAMRLGLSTEAYVVGEVIAKVAYDNILKGAMQALPSLDWNSILSSSSTFASSSPSSSSSSSSSSPLSLSLSLPPPPPPIPTDSSLSFPSSIHLSPNPSPEIHLPSPSSFSTPDSFESSSSSPSIPLPSPTLSSYSSNSSYSPYSVAPASDPLSSFSLSTLSSISTIDIATLENLLLLPTPPGDPFFN